MYLRIDLSQTTKSKLLVNEHYIKTLEEKSN